MAARKILVGCAAAVCAAALPAIFGGAAAGQTAEPSAEPAANSVSVARGIVVPILVTREVRVGASGTSQEEHKVKFAVDRPVIYNGYVIAKPGDLAEGHYDTQTNQTKREFSNEVSQEVDLYVDDVVNFCGDTIYVSFEKTFVGGVRSGFLSFGVHAHDAVVAQGDVLQASTDRAQRNVCAEPAPDEVPEPRPKGMITPEPELTPSPSPDSGRP